MRKQITPKSFYIHFNLSNSKQSVNLEFSLVDDLNVEVVKDSKTIELAAGETREENVIMTIPDDLVGEYTLILNAESEVASVLTKEEVLLGSSGAGTGFAGSGQGRRSGSG